MLGFVDISRKGSVVFGFGVTCEDVRLSVGFVFRGLYGVRK